MGPRLTRLPQWRARLEAAIAVIRPFRWGESDCCLMAADLIRAMTGCDLAAAVRGKYHCAREALSILGAQGVAGIATEHLGQPILATLARDGDVCLVHMPRPMLGVCVGSRIVLQGAVGAEYVPLDRAVCAWRV